LAEKNIMKNRSLAHFKSQRGIGMTEILVVALILLLLSAVAAPQVKRTMEQYRLNSSTSLVMSKLNEARMQAIKRNAQVWLALDSTTRTIQIQMTVSGATVNLATAAQLPGQVQFATGCPAAITFNSLGRLMTAAQTLTLQGESSGQTKSITISPTGQSAVS
jgi:Tfp pilus assembly protein FimT